MSAYYNEHDKFNVEWLKHLMAANLIAPGEIDGRNIQDVQPADLRGFTQWHFFAGIGVWSYALRCAGWSDSQRVRTGSCPCQPFSVSGKRGGASDERHLWPDFFRLIRGSDEEQGVVTTFGEQVASDDGLAWLDLVSSDLEGQGYTVGAVDTPACGFGAPHRRQRLYWVADTESAEQTGGMGDDQRTRLERHIGDERDGNESGRERENAAGSTPKTGILNGFWNSADWLYCRDEKYRPVEPLAQPMVDGSAESLGSISAAAVQEITKEILNAYPSERDAREAVFYLRKALTAQALDEWNAGRLHSLQQAPFLLAFLCQLAEQGWSFAKGVSRSRKKVTREMLRGVRVNEETSCPSCRRGLDEQRGVECSNALHLVSSVLARHAQTEWGKAFQQNAEDAFPLIRGALSRVGRLRGYGNALVAPQAEGFIRAYMEIACG